MKRDRYLLDAQIPRQEWEVGVDDAFSKLEKVTLGFFLYRWKIHVKMFIDIIYLIVM